LQRSWSQLKLISMLRGSRYIYYPLANNIF
jgi:hypothetical protein